MVGYVLVTKTRVYTKEEDKHFLTSTTVEKTFRCTVGAVVAVLRCSSVTWMCDGLC